MAVDPLREVKISKKKIFDFKVKKSILWEIHNFQASLLKIATQYSSIQKLYFLKVSATWTVWCRRGSRLISRRKISKKIYF